MNPEDKQRIEEEEHRRAQIEEEERYRAEFRVKLKGEQPPAPPAVPTMSKRTVAVMITAAILVGVTFLWVLPYRRTAYSLQKPSTVPVISTFPVDVSVGPSQTRWVKIDIPYDAIGPYIRGMFYVDGGAVHAAIFGDGAAVLQWADGHASDPIWTTDKRVSTYYVECCSSLEGGTYYIAFANRPEIAEGAQLVSEALRYGVGGSLGALLNLLSPEHQTLAERLQATGQKLTGVLDTFTPKHVRGGLNLVYRKQKQS